MGFWVRSSRCAWVQHDSLVPLPEPWGNGHVRGTWRLEEYLSDRGHGPSSGVVLRS